MTGLCGCSKRTWEKVKRVRDKGQRRMQVSGSTAGRSGHREQGLVKDVQRNKHRKRAGNEEGKDSVKEMSECPIF